MDKKAILGLVDHTELNPAAKWADIATLIDDAITYGTATVCILVGLFDGTNLLEMSVDLIIILIVVSLSVIFTRIKSSDEA